MCHCNVQPVILHADIMIAICFILYCVVVSVHGISVMMPWRSHTVCATIDKVIKHSILKQTLPPDRVLIGMSGPSAPNNLDVACLTKALIVLREHNIELKWKYSASKYDSCADSRNAARQLLTHDEVFFWHDSDDHFHPQWIEYGVWVLDNHPNVDVVLPNYIMHNAHRFKIVDKTDFGHIFSSTNVQPIDVSNGVKTLSPNGPGRVILHHDAIRECTTFFPFSLPVHLCGHITSGCPLFRHNPSYPYYYDQDVNVGTGQNFLREDGQFLYDGKISHNYTYLYVHFSALCYKCRWPDS